jgi:ABC-2 type transport system permease protein
MSTMSTSRAIWVLYRRSLRELIALGPQTLVVPLIVPCFILLAYSGLASTVFVRLNLHVVGLPGFGPRPHYIQYLVAAPVAMAALLATASAGVGVAVERQLGFYERMQLSPFGPSISQIGRRLGDGTRIALFVTVLTVVGWVAGVRIADWPLALAVTIPLATTLGIAYGGLAFSICLRTGSAEAAQAITPLFLPALFMSTAFIPLPLIPGWLHIVAEYNPLSAVCDAIRLADVGMVKGSVLLKSVAGIGGLGVITQTLVLRAERRVGMR